MMNIRHTTLVFMIALALQPLAAQPSLHLKSGLSASSFFFKNSKGETDKSFRYLISNYSALGCDANFGRHAIISALGFRQVGASTLISQTKVKWDIKYLDLNLGYGFNYYSSPKVMLGIGAGVNLGILLKAEQSIGSEAYNLLKDNALRQIDLGANGFANAKIKMAEGVYLSLEYRYNVSMLNIETDKQAPAQTTRNQSHNFLAGIAINLRKPAKAEKPVNTIVPDTLALQSTKLDTTPALPTTTPPPVAPIATKTNEPDTLAAPAPAKTAAAAVTQPAQNQTSSNPVKPKLTSGSRLVVIGAVIKEADAKAMADSIKAKGYPAGYFWIQDYEPNGRPMYRVYAGPYTATAAAKDVLPQLKGIYSNAYYYEIK